MHASAHPLEEPILLTPWPWTSSIHTVEEHISVAENHPVRGIVLQQPSKLTEVKCESVSYSVMPDPLRPHGL